MPKTIVTETPRSKQKEACAPPVPECKLSKREVEWFSKELTKYMKQFAPAFERIEQVKHSQAYVQGLLSNVTRKNVEQMALGLGKKVRYYRRRAWIEEMFGDFKKQGFDLERTMLRHAARLSRLTLAVAFLYAWLLSVGSRTIRVGLRHLVDHKDRRDLSIFQIGLRFIERKLIGSLPISAPLWVRS